MSKKIAIFAFNGEPMCFVHVLLNTLDMLEKGYDVKLIIEGSATRLLHDLSNPDRTFSSLYVKVKESGVIDCVCKACSAKMGSLKSAEEQSLPLCDELSGHPSVSRYLEMGYKILIF